MLYVANASKREELKLLTIAADGKLSSAAADKCALLFSLAVAAAEAADQSRR